MRVVKQSWPQLVLFLVVRSGKAGDGAILESTFDFSNSISSGVGFTTVESILT